MNIWLIQVGEPLPVRAGVRQQRLSMLSRELSKRGHRVVRWGSCFDHITKRMLYPDDTDVSISSNVVIKTLRGCGYKKNVSLTRYIDHAIIARKFWKMARRADKPDVILAATPPHNIAYVAVKFSKESGIPVVVDIRDQWPDVFRDIMPSYLRSFYKMISFRDRMLLRFALSNADGITANMNDLLQWGLNYAERGCSEWDRVFYIGTRPAKTVSGGGVRKELYELMNRIKNKFVVLYVGTFNRYYNPTILVDVARRFATDSCYNGDVVFVLAGSGQLYPKIEKMAAGLSNMELTGWLSHEEIEALLNYANVGVCPLNEDRPCFPNKAFIYLSASLPVISSIPGELKDEIEQYGLGLNFKPGDRDGLYDNITKFVGDLEYWERSVKCVKEAFSMRYDADVIYSGFADYLEKVAEHNR